VKLGEFRDARQQLQARALVVGAIELLHIAANQHADRPGLRRAFGRGTRLEILIPELGREGENLGTRLGVDALV
jgi:hypothetical protein